MELEKFRFISFENENDAIIRESQLTTNAHFIDGVTTRYSNIIKRTNLESWLLPILNGYEYLFTEDELNNSIWIYESEI